jgi:hypothetical protein
MWLKALYVAPAGTEGEDVNIGQLMTEQLGWPRRSQLQPDIQDEPAHQSSLLTFGREG